MSCLFRVSSTILLRTSQSISNNTLSAGSCSFSPWKKCFINAGVSVRDTKDSKFRWRLQVQCYSSRNRKTGSAKSGTKALMGEEKDTFFVVRKGDLIGVYNSLSDCQAQIGSSICDPPVSVYKGYTMQKDTEDYLASRGLKGAAYTIRAADLKNDLFGTLFPCPVEISIKGDSSATLLLQKGSTEDVGRHIAGAAASTSKPATKILNQGADIGTQVALPAHASRKKSCKIEFDGASKGNPGPAGAGAVLRAEDGTVICRLREGLGTATNNEAEYRAMILGLKHAHKKGYTHIHVQGDSKLVCMQVQDLWKTCSKNMANLCREAKSLKTKFTAFEIKHVLRGSNADADAQANLAIKLTVGQVEESFDD